MALGWSDPADYVPLTDDNNPLDTVMKMQAGFENKLVTDPSKAPKRKLLTREEVMPSESIYILRAT